VVVGRWYEDGEREQDAREVRKAAQEAFGPWLATLRPWELFGTLTYDPVNLGFVRGEWSSGVGTGASSSGRPTVPASSGSKVGRVVVAPVPSVAPLAGGVSGRRRAYVPSQWKARRDAEFWLRDAARDLGRAIVGVVVVEFHVSGWPHLHALVDSGGLQHGDIEKLGRLWFNRGRRGLGGGYNRLEVPRSQEDVTGYCAKYMTKTGFEQLVIHGRLEQRRLAGPTGPGRRRRRRRS
jgi:hypothetical protein